MPVVRENFTIVILAIVGDLGHADGGRDGTRAAPAGMTRRYLVAGRVQGVGFRWYAARHARGLASRGSRGTAGRPWEVIATGGDAAASDRLEELLRAGRRKRGRSGERAGPGRRPADSPEELDIVTIVTPLARIARTRSGRSELSEPGIIFQDITPSSATARCSGRHRGHVRPIPRPDVTHVVGIEAGGHPGGAVADNLGAGFSRRGSRQAALGTRGETYDLEYGKDARNATGTACRAGPGLIVDDVLATAAQPGRQGSSSGRGRRGGRLDLPARIGPSAAWSSSPRPRPTCWARGSGPAFRAAFALWSMGLHTGRPSKPGGRPAPIRPRSSDG